MRGRHSEIPTLHPHATPLGRRSAPSLPLLALGGARIIYATQFNRA
ncbi:MAG: hypothetical protein AVDCRST_MAG42-1970 [uncultured Chthoniobacterales bacterium]|uniref:Uncharacterized protein n=1 Tax=uncultured Chthoniobacterales bacterium TaxID=1836801 RepID=A0A6J4IC35_9BACT|nr:MAG: hypothetical protein AVDCRST_MAG42-1970 [uncultured Chthoniobacterales bacterium]